MFLVQFSGGAHCAPDRLLTKTTTSFYHFQAELHISWVFLLEKCTLCDGIVWLHSSLYTSCPYEFFVSCRSERSIYGMMLHGHTFKKTRAESLTECVMACNNGAICQSVNYIINEDVCELNNRTKKARPDDLVPHENSIYVTRFSERGIGRGSRVVM